MKGFGKEEIAKIMSLKEEDIDEAIKTIDMPTDITSSSVELYSEMQKDLSKLILTEMNKENRDSNVILNAIKLQSQLQEQKLGLSRRVNVEKINKGYIYERDGEIAKMKFSGMREDEIAKKLNIGVLSVKQALDRYNLELPDHLKTLSPSIISETISLDNKTRLKLLERAYNEKMSREDIRKLVVEIKNEAR